MLFCNYFVNFMHMTSKINIRYISKISDIFDIFKNIAIFTNPALYNILWQASIASLTYFFYDVILHCRPLTYEMAYLLHICGGFFWEFNPLNVVGHRADPKKALA